MKRTVLAAVILLVGLTLYAGGRQERPAADAKPTELELVTTPEWARSVEPTLAAFTAQHGIRVKVTVIPYDQLFNQLTTTIIGGQTVDVMELDPAWLAEMNKQGMVIPLNDRVSEADLAEYLPASVDLMSVDGTLVGLPMVAGIPYFFYNAPMLQNLGFLQPPSTWAEVETISQAAVRAGVADHGIFLGLAPLEGFMVYFDVFLKLQGGDWMNADKSQWTFNNAQGVAALTYLKHLIDSGVVPRAALETPDRESLNTFLAGRAPFHFNWGFTYGLMTDTSRSQVAEAVRGALVPGIVARSYTTMGGGGYAVAKTTRSERWALELAKWLTTGDAPRAMLAGRGSDMAWAELYEDRSVFDRHPLLRTYVDQLQYAGVRPSAYLTWYSEFRDNIFMPLAHRALLGQIGIQDALNQAQQQASARLQQVGL